tara:strand:+ start:1058 stop:1588 length:531 start_codon:yes stop_codon:yes gene_type:complete
MKINKNEQFWIRIIYIVSAIVSLAVAFLILGPRPQGIKAADLDVSFLPTLNAILNTITTLLLLYGYYLIKKKRRAMHRNIMLAAFATSTGFLVSYIIYHWFKSGPKLYTGEFSSIYYTVLISHIILAAIIIPLALLSLYRGWNSEINKHRKIAAITLPIWLYVSITGVVIYTMLYL